MTFSNRDKTILVLAVAFIGFLIWSSVQFQHFFTSIVPYFENLTHRNSIFSIAVFIGLAILSTMVSSFSSVPLVPIAIIVWGILPTALFLFFGWMTGDILAYLIAYSGAYPLLKKFLPLEKIEFYRKKIPPDAEFKLVFFFIMSMPAEIPNYVLGTLRYSFLKYLAIMALGEFVFAFLTAYAGQALVEKNFILFIGAVSLLLTFFAYFFFLFNKYLRAK
ncbi:MAG: VTT domain-containing protein [Candidatus Moranbacteria bacterium]|nr:VTT domain-containing protein [Candidatus Moranbacteria bacterium]